MMWRQTLCFSGFFINAVTAADPDWSKFYQLDYDVKLERAHTELFNRSYFSVFKCEFVPIKRTERAINMTCNLLRDLSSNFWMEIKMYKFASNEYRDFPLSCALNLCTECKRNSFGCKDMLLNYSNIPLCPLKKGVYHLGNAIPDFSKFPPYIPRGRYQAKLKLYNNNNFLVEIHAFTEIKDKPLKWSNN